MKCILLAAGYATRLYPLTENMPKALLPLGRKTILDLVIEKIEEIKEIDDIYIVTNNKFFNHFTDWSNQYSGRMHIEVINDFTTSNDNRLGAIGDMQYVIDQKAIDDEILVMASDNIFDFSLVDFVDMYRRTGKDTICTNHIGSKKDLQTMGVAIIDADGRVTGFEEKPAEPKSTWGVSPFYLYTKETVRDIKQYLGEGNNPDAPGYFIPWLIQHKDVYAFVFDGIRLDVGTAESYKEAQTLDFVK